MLLPEHLTFPLLSVTLLVSFGSSMLYGYNLAVVNSPAEHIKAFYNATWSQRYGHGLGPAPLTLLYALTVSIFALGGLGGSLLVGLLAERYGRNGALSRSALLVLLAGGFMGFSRELGSPEMVIIGRSITGIHSVVVVPASLQLLLLHCFPESPRYLLIERNDICGATKALQQFLGSPEVQDVIEEMQEEQRSLSCVEMASVWQLLRERSLRWQTLSALMEKRMDMSFDMVPSNESPGTNASKRYHRILPVTPSPWKEVTSGSGGI
ncbi:hypothetical protein EK904_011062 [Melospiza melodia maxima]|nr:hypothetical protein EK904_011062 [Melospiza melodia maxima]